jgi:hypothetical protein
MGAIKLTKKQQTVMKQEKKRIMAEGSKIFLKQTEGKVAEGAEDSETLEFLTLFFADAFWQGYVFSTFERVKADHEENQE